MRKIEELFKAFLIGVGIGNIITIIIALIIGKYFPVVPEFYAKQPSMIEAVIKANVLYGVLGVVGYISGKIYNRLNVDETPKRNIFACTFLNLSINIIFFLGVGFYLEWFKFEYIIYPVAMYIIIYFVIWVYEYFKCKKNIEDINKKLGN